MSKPWQLLIALEDYIGDADLALKLSDDILATPPDRLGLPFSDRELAKSYVNQATRAMLGIQSLLAIPFEDARKAEANDEEGL